MKNYLQALFVASTVLVASQAEAVTLTFENLAVGTTLSTQYAAQGVSFSPNAFTGAGSSTSGQPWATNTDMTIVSSTGSDVGGLGTPSLVSGNLLRSYNGWVSENGDPSFRASFSTSITFFSADFAGVSTPADVRLFAYNGSTLLGTVAGTTTTGQFTLSFAAPLITSVVVTPGSYYDWVGVDNVTYSPLATLPIPEPETYALMLGGLGLLGIVARRRRQA